MRNLVKQEESKNGKYRVNVYYDEYAESPCTNWDLGATYLFEYKDSYFFVKQEKRLFVYQSLFRIINQY